MTLTEQPAPPAPMAAPPHLDDRPALVISTAALGGVDGRRLTMLSFLWALVGLVGMVVVAFGLGPYLCQRDQRVMIEELRGATHLAANEAFGLQGAVPPTKAPEFGTPVAIMEAPAVRMQVAVVEGVNPGQTQRGPGHVPGTAAPGQPGNSVILGRAGAFGGPFAVITALKAGDEILFTTTQAQFVYKVDAVRNQTLLGQRPEGELPAVDPQAPAGSAALPADGATGGTVAVDDLYGASSDDRLTLVTSSSSLPWNASDATVVVARLQGRPYQSTPQNGRTDSQSGLAGDGAALAALVLVLMAFSGSALIAAALYRGRAPFVAYLLSTPPLITFIVIGGETLSRLFPAWM